MTKHQLDCSALNAQPVSYDFSAEKCADINEDGAGWSVVYPDVDSWDLEQCREYLDDNGIGYPDPDPWEMSRDDMATELVEAGYFEGTDEEGTDPDALAGVPKEFLIESMVDAIDNEVIDGIDDWREAVTDHIQGDGADSFTPMMNYYYPLPGLRLSAEEAQEKVMGTGSCVVVLVDDEPVLALAGGGMDLSPDICNAYIALGFYPPMHFAENLPRLGTAYREITPELIDICLEGARIALSWAQDSVDRLEGFKAGVEQARNQQA